MNKYFAICPRGLEELLSAELATVGASELKTTHGGVFFSGDWLPATAPIWNPASRRVFSGHVVKGPYFAAKTTSINLVVPSCGRTISMSHAPCVW
jgi:putative N6-adenine-specific DNA methylase